MGKIVTTLLAVLFLYGTTNAQAIGTGFSWHTISVNNAGLVYSWGDNSAGTFGDSTTTSSSVPVAAYTAGVLSGKTITAVSTGSSYSIALASDGTLYSWGYNGQGQLGDNSLIDKIVPVAVYSDGVLSGKTITAIATGGSHTLALASDGTVYAWGWNRDGQLGNNSTTDSSVPVAVNTSGVLSGKTITKIAAGINHSIAIDSDGTIYTWGSNSDGQLGNNSTTNSLVPVAVTTSGVLSGKTITAATGSSRHTVAVSTEGQVFSWGANSIGQLGDNSTTSSLVPVMVYSDGVLSGKTITAVASGQAHSLALDSDGKVYSWGGNWSGELGNNTSTSSQVPVEVYNSGVLSGKTITAIGIGEYHSIALGSDGTVYCWGENWAGQLGNNTTDNSNVPVEVSGAPLPVELTSFSALVVDGKVELSWQTATELNNYGFEIQKSASNSTWKKIGFVEGNGNSNATLDYSFTDNSPIAGRAKYRLKQIDTDGKYTYSKELEVSSAVPTQIELAQNYPNPFNPSTTIKFGLTEDTRVSLKIYNLLGEEVAVLINNKTMNAGQHSRSFNADKLASGTYIYRLSAGKNVMEKKMILVK